MAINSTTDGLYPIPAFHFSVNFADGDCSTDTAFQSVSGIKVDIKYDDYAEGGANDRCVRLPVSMSHPNLVLKRGLTSTDSGLYQWISGILAGSLCQPIRAKMLNIMLLDETGQPSKVWEISDALPVKWDLDEFNSTANKVALETIELTYSKFYRTL